MTRIKVREVRTGLHPSEVVVEVRTASGDVEKVVVDRRSIQNGSLAIGYPVAQKDDQFLVELPRESVRGAWRVWVSRETLAEEVAA